MNKTNSRISMTILMAIFTQFVLITTSETNFFPFNPDASSSPHDDSNGYKHDSGNKHEKCKNLCEFPDCCKKNPRKIPQVFKDDNDSIGGIPATITGRVVRILPVHGILYFFISGDTTLGYNYIRCSNKSQDQYFKILFCSLNNGTKVTVRRFGIDEKGDLPVSYLYDEVE